MNVYDFDGTIYSGDSTIDFYFFMLRSDPTLVRYILKQMWGFFGYAFKCLGKTQMKEYFFCFLSGIDVTVQVENFWNKYQKRIYHWYMNQHEKDDIVISASPEFLLLPICERIGIKYLIASKVDIHTGKFEGPNCRGKEKVNRLVREMGIEHIDKFYSDSISDLPLAEIAEAAYLVKGGKPQKWF